MEFAVRRGYSLLCSVNFTGGANDTRDPMFDTMKYKLTTD